MRRSTLSKLVCLTLCATFAALPSLGCGGTAAKPTAEGTAVRGTGGPENAAAARAAWDAAVGLRPAGDELGARSAMRELARDYPGTRHGDAAANAGDMSAVLAVSAVGVMAAVAVPAFMKYIRRSKTAEASMNVRQLFDASASYAMEHCKDAKSCAKVARFPPSAPLTPPRSACENGKSVALQPAPGTFDHPTWKALGFSVDTPSYFQYEYVSSGTGANSAFTARAIGDLDCDGVFSTFERTGRLDATGNVNGDAGMLMKDELE